MTFKVTQGDRNCYCSMVIGHFVLKLCSNNVSVLHRIGDYHVYSARDCLWPCEVLQFRQDTWNYKSCAFSDSCV